MRKRSKVEWKPKADQDGQYYVTIGTSGNSEALVVPECYGA